MIRAHNFSAGPCTLPVAVIEELAADLPNIEEVGASIIEISHRSAQYKEVSAQTVELLRELGSIPEDFEILLLQGGATLQFTMAAENAGIRNNQVAYAVAGTWGKKAFADASLLGKAYKAWDGEPDGFTRMCTADELDLASDPDYIHVTTNETIHGIAMAELPATDHKVIADMSSDFFTRAIDWNTIAVAYGGAQKSLGPAGLCVVIVHNSVIEKSPQLPAYMSYAKHAEAESMANTPSVFAVWATYKMLKWMKAQGGLASMDSATSTKADLIYTAVDSSGGFYVPRAEHASRSRTNVVFNLSSPEAEADFLTAAASNGLINLKGHRSIGGIRASLYNGLAVESAQALADFMNEYRTENA